MKAFQDLIKESEERVKRETEAKFQERIQELEKRSLYLDRSLELIEEMKRKFGHFEGGRTQMEGEYNDLLMKYNGLLFQFNTVHQQNSQSLLNQEKKRSLGQKSKDQNQSGRSSPTRVGDSSKYLEQLIHDNSSKEQLVQIKRDR